MNIDRNLLTAIGLFTTTGLLLMALLATYPAVIAYEKGRKFWPWYGFGLILWPLALLCALMLKPLPHVNLKKQGQPSVN